MLNKFYSDPSTLRRMHFGPLGEHIDAFAEWLSQQGYERELLRYKIRWVAYLSHWLHRHRLRVEDLNEQRIERFLRRRCSQSDLRHGNFATFRDLLRWLWEAGIVAPAVLKHDETALGCLERDFVLYLTQERGLSAATVKNYLPTAHRFISEHFSADSVVLGELTAKDVTDFILRQTQIICPRRMQLVVTALRAFLRFLWLRGGISCNLAAAAPTVPNHRWAELPKSIPPEQVKRLLKSCEQRRPVGRRDYAILLLMARLGLRTMEILTMSLDDIDWEAGLITIHGKGKRQDQLPITHDVGRALAEYLRHGRPHCSTRRLFVRSRAPFVELARSSVSMVVRHACARAGLSPPHQGANILRHSLATNMLRQGASLREIGEIMRHRQPSTTEIYAKVDFKALRAVAQPWMGG